MTMCNEELEGEIVYGQEGLLRSGLSALCHTQRSREFDPHIARSVHRGHMVIWYGKEMLL
jgi:hypothetical protein